MSPIPAQAWLSRKRVGIIVFAVALVGALAYDLYPVQKGLRTLGGSLMPAVESGQQLRQDFSAVSTCEKQPAASRTACLLPLVPALSTTTGLLTLALAARDEYERAPDERLASAIDAIVDRFPQVAKHQRKLDTLLATASAEMSTSVIYRALNGRKLRTDMIDKTWSAVQHVYYSVRAPEAYARVLKARRALAAPADEARDTNR